jgi:hypothetical protein
MKKLIALFILVLAIYNTGKAARIITNFDIARWYLDADLVLIGNVVHTDTILIHHHDSLVADGFHETYDVIREKYHLSVDSILKSKGLIGEKRDSIFTPLFLTDRIQQKIEFKGLNENGDSIFFGTIKGFTDFNDYGYFRIRSTEKQIVLLHQTSFGYVIDFTTKADASMMDLIREVNKKGESYFTDFFEPQVDTLPVYDHYCQSMNPYEIDTTIFKYQNDTLYIRNVKNEFCCPRNLLALVKNGIDTLKINVVNPEQGDCACDCSYGYTVKVHRAPFDYLTVRINNEDFNLTKADLEQPIRELFPVDPCIYPNPIKDQLHITGLLPNKIELVNLNGEIQKVAIQDPQNIDVRSLKPGVYILSVYLGKTIRKEKLIKE